MALPHGLSRRAFIASVVAFVAAGCRSNRDRGIPASLPKKGEPLYVPEARAYVVDVPPESLAAALEVYPEALHAGMKAGVLALSQKCTHLGCRVPFCSTSNWFECSCHGAMFSRTGEKRGGPAPRGMDFFPVQVRDGDVVIDTSRVIEGLPIGTAIIGVEASGPHCY